MSTAKTGTEALEAAAVEALGDKLSGKTPAATPVLSLSDWGTGDTFDFESEFQDSVAALVALNPNFMMQTRDCIEPTHFDSAGNAILVNLAQSYYDRYGRLPGKMAIWAQLITDSIKSKQIKSNFKDEVVSALKLAKKADISDSKFISDKVSEFSKHQDIMTGLQESIDLAGKGDFEAIERRMQSAFQKGAKGEYREADYWEDIEIRTQKRKDIASGLIKSDGIPLGIKEIDNKLHHKGLGRGELTALLAGAKRGKSMGLGDLAVRFSKQGYNVLYVTCEVSVSIIGDRMDANVSRTDMDDISDSVNKVSDKVNSEKKRRKTDGEGRQGVLKIVEFPSGTLTPNGLRAYIERYKAMGIQFDVIVPDYADIMAPNIYTNSETENSKQVWLGLRAIASRENAVMLTATQTNREGFKADTARAEHAAEDFNKIRIADLVISINRTEDERANGEARLFIAASRNQAGEFTIHVKQDLAKMSFIESVMSIY